MSKNAVIFVDVSNLFFALKSEYKSKLDYSKLLEYCQGLGVVRAAYAYGGYFKNNRPFIDSLEHAGFTPKFQKCKVYAERVKCNVDPEIMMDIVELIEKRPSVQLIILASADSDFTRVVKYCQDKGKQVFILARKISKELQETADYCVEIPKSMLLESK